MKNQVLSGIYGEGRNHVIKTKHFQTQNEKKEVSTAGAVDTFSTAITGYRYLTDY